MSALDQASHLPGRGMVVWQNPCLAEWLDYNGHMNETYYLLAASRGTDRFMELVGCDAAYRESGQGTLYTLESHIRYFLEVMEGEVLTVTCQLVERDAKRLRLYNRIWLARAEDPVAAVEFLLLHVAGTPPRGCPFAPPLESGLAELAQRQADLPWPEDAGRGIKLKR